MRVWLLALAMLATALSGCSGAEQLVVQNNPGNFQMAGQVAGKSGSVSYTWDNPSNTAMVQWGGQSGSGAFTLSVRDAAGKTVYTNTISGASQGGSQQDTSSGKAGAWQIVLDFDSFTGQMGLQVLGDGYGGSYGGWGNYGGYGG